MALRHPRAELANPSRMTEQTQQPQSQEFKRFGADEDVNAFPLSVPVLS